MQFALAGADVAVEVAADMQATLVLADNAYRLDELAVTVDGSGAGWPGGPSQAELSFESLVANLGDETLELNGLTLEFLGITMAGSLSGQRLMSDLALTGAVDIREFAPREVLERFDVAVADGRRRRAHARERESEFALQLEPSRAARHAAHLDDSTLTGRVALEGERLTYDLTVDDINVDRYLPPSEEADAPAEEGSLDEVDLPLDVLRTLDARGELKFGQAKFSGLTLTNAAFALNAGNGAVRLTPSAQLYGGRVTGDIRVQVEADSARMNVEQNLDDVDLAAARPGSARLAGHHGHGRRALEPRDGGAELGRDAPRARRRRRVHGDERLARRHRPLVRAAARARAARRRRRARARRCAAAHDVLVAVGDRRRRGRAC